MAALDRQNTYRATIEGPRNEPGISIVRSTLFAMYAGPAGGNVHSVYSAGAEQPGSPPDLGYGNLSDRHSVPALERDSHRCTRPVEAGGTLGDRRCGYSSGKIDCGKHRK